MPWRKTLYMAQRASRIIRCVAASKRTDSKQKTKPKHSGKVKANNNVMISIGFICILNRALENFKFRSIFYSNYTIDSDFFNAHLCVKVLERTVDA